MKKLLIVMPFAWLWIAYVVWHSLVPLPPAERGFIWFEIPFTVTTYFGFVFLLILAGIKNFHE